MVKTKIVSGVHPSELIQSSKNAIQLTQFKSNIFFQNKTQIITNRLALKSKQKNADFDFFDSVIGFLYLVMFVIFTAMYFILLIAAYASMPLVIALGLAMLLSLLTCITGQFIQV
ncbi:MAG: hypothetical protein IM600_06180 [Bacteroidetes bacterium]|nr:hypothetical protein [Bacteroidota bacterium]MCA6443002.1 hypothetical protein [Bacteroidota bacterium]